MKGFVSSRNFIGGFCGGFVGLLLFKLLWPAFLPVGCFVGFTLGYARRELFGVLKNAFRRVANWRGTASSAVQGHVQTRINRVRSFFSAAHARFVLFWTGVRRFGAGVREFGLYLVKLMRHPMMPAYALRAFAVLLFVRLNFLWLNPVANGYADLARAHHVFIVPLLAMVFMGFAVAWVPICLYLVWRWTDWQVDRGPAWKLAEKQRVEWRTRLYKEHGALYFFGRDFLALCGGELLMLLVVTSFILYGLIGGGLLLFAGVLPFMIAVMCVRVICSSSRSGEYWIGLGATLIVTALSAWLNYARLNGSWLWIIALLTGCVAGVSAEALRRLVVAAIDRWPQIEAFSRQPLKDHLRPVSAGYWRIGKEIFAKQWSLKATLVPES